MLFIYCNDFLVFYKFWVCKFSFEVRMVIECSDSINLETNAVFYWRADAPSWANLAFSWVNLAFSLFKDSYSLFSFCISSNVVLSLSSTCALEVLRLLVLLKSLNSLYSLLYSSCKRFFSALSSLINFSYFLCISPNSSILEMVKWLKVSFSLIKSWLY